MTEVVSSAAVAAPAEYAAELRTFAQRLRAIRFRGTEAYLEDIDEFVHALTRRADELSPRHLGVPNQSDDLVRRNDSEHQG